MTGGSRLLRYSLLGLGVLAGGVALVALMLTLAPPRVYQKDFVQEYVLARALADGGEPYTAVDRLAQRYLGTSIPDWTFDRPTPHPPSVAVLFLPMATIDYPTATRVWFGVELVCAGASVWLLARSVGGGLPLWAVAAVTLVLVAWQPLRSELRLGQLTLLLLLPLAGARLLFVKHPRLAGALLGLTMLIKPILWPVLLVLLARRMWRALATSIVTPLVGYAVVAWVVGLPLLVTYFVQVLPPWYAMYRNSTRNLSLWTIGSRIFNGTSNGITVPPLLPSAAAASIASILVPSAVLVVCLYVSRRMQLQTALGLMVCASVLVSPVVWSFTFVLELVPAACVFTWLKAHDFPRHATYTALAVAALTFIPFEWWSMLAGLLDGQPLTLSGPDTLSFTASILTLGPTLALALVGWVVATTDPHFKKSPRQVLH